MITHFAIKKGFFGDEILRENPIQADNRTRKSIFLKLAEWEKRAYIFILLPKERTVQLLGVNSSLREETTLNCCIAVEDSSTGIESTKLNQKNSCSCKEAAMHEIATPLKKLLIETWKAFSMVTKFMAIAFFINALINFYLPKDFLSGFIGADSQLSVLFAALVGIPFYTSNLSALPIVSGLLSLGMNQGAALAFLIAGPVTTLPAMMAVWGIVRSSFFYAYLLFSFSGAILFSYLFNFMR